jgi:pre-mRNA-splicing factor ISY1
MYQGITAGYYGFGDDEDPTMLAAEAEAEAEVRKAAIAEWEESEGLKAAARANVNHVDDDAPSFVAHVPLPDVKEIEQAVLLKKKKDLMARYASASLQKDEEEAKVSRRTHCRLHNSLPREPSMLATRSLGLCSKPPPETALRA